MPFSKNRGQKGKTSPGLNVGEICTYMNKYENRKMRQGETIPEKGEQE
jgi:hypothetical protein